MCLGGCLKQQSRAAYSVSASLVATYNCIEQYVHCGDHCLYCLYNNTRLKCKKDFNKENFCSSQSYGGYMGAMVGSSASGVYKAAISQAPVTDWRFYGQCACAISKIKIMTAAL